MDPRTLFYGALMMDLCCAAGLYLMSRTAGGLRGLQWFTLAYLSIAVGLLRDFSFHQPPSIAAIDFTRFCTVLSAVLFTQGAAEFVVQGARALSWGAWLLVWATLGEVLLAYAGQGGYAPAGIFLFGMVYGAQTLVAMALLLSHRVAGERVPCRVTAVLLGLSAGIILLRGFLVLGGFVAGALAVASPLRTVTTSIYIAATVSLAFGLLWMAIARQQAKLEQQTLTDALTGALNRRALDTAAQNLLAVCRARGAALSVLAIDLDHFKQLNDTFGHAGGDAVLVAASQLLSRSLRPTDVVARFGGEEFIALLPERDGTSAVVVAERLRRLFERLEVEYEDHRLRVTASFGIAHLGAVPPGGDAWTELLRQADSMLYRAKLEGRNCIRAVTDEAPPAMAADAVHA